MANIVVNAVGEQCPIPVVKATRALREMTEPGTLEVHVDNEIAVQNLTRMAGGNRLPVRAEKVGEKEFVVTMEVTEQDGRNYFYVHWIDVTADGEEGTQAICGRMQKWLRRVWK